MKRNFGFRPHDPVEAIRRANEIDTRIVLIGLACAIGIILWAAAIS